MGKRSFLLLTSLILLLAGRPFPASSVSPQAESSSILTYSLKGTIHGGSDEIIGRMIDQVRNKNHKAILITLDTPGGLLDSTEDIVKKILNAPVPVIIYVAPQGARAGSAGMFITLAAHVAAMAPGTYIGAAHPVYLFGNGKEEGGEDSVMKKKIESAAASFIEAIAKQRGRNVEWARKAVLESESVTSDTALDKKVIDLVASNSRELLDQVDGRIVTVNGQTQSLSTASVTLVDYKPGFGLRFLNWLASPTVIYLLILGVFLGVYLEVSQPGIFLPGVLAALCLILVLFATRTLPINTLGILLMLAALGLLVAEIFVTSFGLLTIAAIICFFTGSLFLFEAPRTEVGVPLPFIVGATAALFLIGVSVAFLVIRTQRRAQTTGREEMIGCPARVERAIAPGKPGIVWTHGESWTAESQEFLEAGTEAIVTEIRGLTLTVKKV